MGSAKAAKEKIVAMEEKVVDAKKEISEAEIWASKMEGKFQEQKGCTNALSKNIVHSIIKLGEASRYVASMH